jgi:hypothetical protein
MVQQVSIYRRSLRYLHCLDSQPEEAVDPTFPSFELKTPSGLETIQEEASVSKVLRFSPHVHAVEYERVTDEERSFVWYDAADYAVFRKYLHSLAQYVQTDPANPGYASAWAITLHQIFHTLEISTQTENLTCVPGLISIVWNEHATGMERVACRPLASEVRRRRKRIMERILRLQALSHMDPAVREISIRQASVALSRPSRMLAQYLALMSSESREE